MVLFESVNDQISELQGVNRKYLLEKLSFTDEKYCNNILLLFFKSIMQIYYLMNVQMLVKC